MGCHFGRDAICITEGIELGFLTIKYRFTTLTYVSLVIEQNIKCRNAMLFGKKVPNQMIQYPFGFYLNTKTASLSGIT